MEVLHLGGNDIWTWTRSVRDAVSMSGHTPEASLHRMASRSFLSGEKDVHSSRRRHQQALPVLPLSRWTVYDGIDFNAVRLPR